MSSISLRNIGKRYPQAKGQAKPTLQNINLDIHSGELLVLVGPSGCGKSTLLRMLAGLEEISEGELLLDGKLANHLPPAKRELAMVFQSYALYPHMNVFDNLGFALKMAGADKAKIAQRVQEVAHSLQISTLLERKPGQLSGGQRQRVAIGRALVRSPKVFLFDEPLSNLDASLRLQMRLEIARLHQQLGATMVYVTHDQVEAMTLGQRIVVLHQGQIAQVGTPQELYRHPANQFVAGFLGTPRMNFLAAASLPPALRQLLPANTQTIGIRAEHVQAFSATFLAADGGTHPAQLCITATLMHHEYLGDCLQWYVQSAASQALLALRMPSEGAGNTLPAAGTELRLYLPPEFCHPFAADGSRIEQTANTVEENRV